MTGPIMVGETEAAKMLGRSRRWLQELRLTGGDAPPSARLGGRVLYRVVDLHEWAAKQVEAAETAA